MAKMKAVQPRNGRGYRERYGDEKMSSSKR